MIIFRQKEFSFYTIDSVFNVAVPRVCLEIMKCIEMYEIGNAHHWIVDKVVNKIVLLTKRGLEIYFGNYTYFIKENENRLMLEFKNYKDIKKEQVYCSFLTSFPIIILICCF